MLFPRRGIWILVAAFAAGTASAQVAESARFKILHDMIALQPAARLGLPLGGGGVELSEVGAVNREKLASEIKKHGEAIPPGKQTTITRIRFSDREIEIELDGGGKGKNPILSKIQQAGGHPSDPKQAAGSKIVLKFADKAPTDLTPEGLSLLLNPVLDFGSGAPGVEDAVGHRPDPSGGQVRIGMDRASVVRSLGRPNNRVRATRDGVEREDWIYNGPGLHTTFVTFENDVVIGIREYRP
jgi:hypothetical protein